MKTIKFLIILIIYSVPIFAQYPTKTFVIKAIDGIGQVDSVIFGSLVSATDSIDIGLNEVNYYGLPHSDIDLRSIQRNIVSQDNLWLGSYSNGSSGVPPFSQDVDLKIDYRFPADELHYVLEVFAKNYPVTIKVVFSSFPEYIFFNAFYKNSDDLYKNLEDNDVQWEMPSQYFESSLDDIINGDAIVIFNDSTENRTLAFYPDIPEGIIYLSKMGNPTIIISPNPTNSGISISNIPREINQIFIYNIEGTLIRKISNVNKNINIDISEFPNGIYLVNVGNSFSKIIKN